MKNTIKPSNNRSIHQDSDQSTLPERLRPLVYELTALVRTTLQSHETLKPAAFVCNVPKNLCTWVEVDTSNQIGKTFSAMEIQIQALAIEADCIFIISSALTVAVNSVEQYDALIDQYGSLEQCPGAFEAVCISVQTYEATWCAMSPLKKLSNQKKGYEFGRLNFVLSENSISRFSGLLRAVMTGNMSGGVK